MNPLTPDRPAPGIRRLDGGWQAIVRVRETSGERVIRSKRFPWSTTLTEMKRWRETQKARAHLKLPAEPARRADGAATFAEDVERYLETVQALESINDRRRSLYAWRDALPAGITRPEIDAAHVRRILDGWKMSGYTVRRRVVTTRKDGRAEVTRRDERRKYSETTLRHRLSDLMNLWTVLDGRSAPNPVRDVTKPKPDVRPLDLPTVEEAERAIAACLRVYRGPLQPDARYRRDGKKFAARLRVMLWTGWPPKQISQLEKKLLTRQIAKASITVARRSKGKGTTTQEIPILPQAVAALEAFDREDAYGPYDRSACRKVLHRGCDLAGVRRFRPYDLRHVFLTMIAVVTGDGMAVSYLGQHSTPQQTERYIGKAKAIRAQQAIAATAAALKPKTKLRRA